VFFFPGALTSFSLFTPHLAFSSLPPPYHCTQLCTMGLAKLTPAIVIAAALVLVVLVHVALVGWLYFQQAAEVREGGRERESFKEMFQRLRLLFLAVFFAFLSRRTVHVFTHSIPHSFSCTLPFFSVSLTHLLTHLFCLHPSLFLSPPLSLPLSLSPFPLPFSPPLSLSSLFSRLLSSLSWTNQVAAFTAQEAPLSSVRDPAARNAAASMRFSLWTSFLCSGGVRPGRGLMCSLPAMGCMGLLLVIRFAVAFGIAPTCILRQVCVCLRCGRVVPCWWWWWCVCVCVYNS